MLVYERAPQRRCNPPPPKPTEVSALSRSPCGAKTASRQSTSTLSPLDSTWKVTTPTGLPDLPVKSTEGSTFGFSAPLAGNADVPDMPPASPRSNPRDQILLLHLLGEMFRCAHRKSQNRHRRIRQPQVTKLEPSTTNRFLMSWLGNTCSARWFGLSPIRAVPTL